LRLAREHPDIHFYWVVFSSSPARAEEARRSAGRFLHSAREKTTVILDFDNAFFPFIGRDIKEYFEQLKQQVSPDIIFTHYRNDLHQDHEVISNLTWNTFRDNLILEYEIAKYDGDLGTPNFFSPISERICNEKVKTILDCFGSQSDKKWFTAETFYALMRLRGIECNAPSGYAEAFYCRKALI
jgi:LmbE family N-acetylglucosaminyl deacetylase